MHYIYGESAMNKLFYFMMPSTGDSVGWVIVQARVDEDKIWERSVEHMVNYGY